MRRAYVIGLIIFTTLYMSLVAFATPAGAESNPSSAKKGLSISPLRTEVTLVPGIPHTGVVTVANTTPKDMDVDMSAEEFSVTDGSYDYIFHQNTDLAKTVSFDPEHISLKPGAKQEVKFRLTLPVDTKTKSYYVSLFAGTKKESANRGIIAYQRVASLLYITTQTTTPSVRTGQLLSIDAPWLLTDDATWTANIKNSGSSHFTSHYTVTARTLFGSPIAQTSGQALILPDTTRLISNTMPQLRLPGLYLMHYNVSLGDTPDAHVERLVLYMPPLAWILLAIIAFGLVAYPTIKRLRKNAT